MRCNCSECKLCVVAEIRVAKLAQSGRAEFAKLLEIESREQVEKLLLYWLANFDCHQLELGLFAASRLSLIAYFLK